MRRIAVIGSLFLVAWGGLPAPQPATLAYTVVAEFPHDKSAFTEGLAFGKGFYEGTGLRGSSALFKKRLSTGEVLKRHALDDRFFGEGVTVIGNRIYQITWQEQTAFKYGRKTFKKLDEFSYEGEGWGLTDDGTNLIMSDGTDVLEWRTPATFEVLRSVSVTYNGERVTNLNELEIVKGQIWANVWLTDTIVRIDPDDGKVTGTLDLSQLADAERAQGSVDATNGIAYMPNADRLFVTGKYWAHIYEIDII